MSVITRSASDVPKQRQPFLAVARLDHGVAEVLEYQAQCGADGIVIVDE